MNDAGLLDPKLDLSGLDLLYRRADVEGHRAGLGVGHQPTRPEDPAETANHLHHVRGRDHGVEIQETAADLLGQIIGADDVGSGLFGLLDLLALSKNQHSHRLAGAVWQHHRPAHHLIGMSWIDTETHGDVHRLVELGKSILLCQLQRLRQRVGTALDLFSRLPEVLS